MKNLDTTTLSILNLEIACRRSRHIQIVIKSQLQCCLNGAHRIITRNDRTRCRMGTQQGLSHVNIDLLAIDLDRKLHLLQIRRIGQIQRGR